MVHTWFWHLCFCHTQGNTQAMGNVKTTFPAWWGVGDKDPREKLCFSQRAIAYTVGEKVKISVAVLTLYSFKTLNSPRRMTVAVSSERSCLPCSSLLFLCACWCLTNVYCFKTMLDTWNAGWTVSVPLNWNDLSFSCFTVCTFTLCLHTHNMLVFYFTHKHIQTHEHTLSLLQCLEEPVLVTWQCKYFPIDLLWNISYWNYAT